MSIGATTRLGLTTWSSGDDPFGRAQFQNDNLALEDIVAAFRSGSTTERNAATGSKYTESFWYDTTLSVLYYYDGTTWVSLDSKAQELDAYSLVPGTASTPQGTSARIARADHKHSVPVASATSISGSNGAGSASSFARSDHDHAIGSNVVGATQIAGEAVGKAKLNTDIVKSTGSVLFDTTNGLSVNVDGTTIEISSNALRIKDASVGKAKLATDVIKASSGIAFSNADGLSFVPNPNGAGTGIATLSMGSSGVTVNGGISFTSSGTPTAAVSDGNLNVDTTNSLLYYRTGSAWKNALWAAGTAGSGAPSAKGVWVSNGTAPTGGQGAVGDIWISY